MVLEFANNGDFNNFSKKYNWLERLSVLKGIIEGLKKIHENNIVHRDFHPGNILSYNFL